MSAQLVTYSMLDTAGTIATPFSSIDISGLAQRGVVRMELEMSVDQSTIKVAADGAVVPSVKPGDNAVLRMEMFQTSSLHNELLAWYNQIRAARDQGDVSQWFGGSFLIAGTVSGLSHYGTGCAPMKVPDYHYQEEAETVTWSIVACNCVQQGPAFSL